MAQNGLRRETDWFEKKFKAFPKNLNRRIVKTHLLLTELRHKAYAHYDAIHWREKYHATGTGADPRAVAIIVNSEQGSYSITPNTFKILPIQEMQYIRKLISFQKGRIENALRLSTNRLRKLNGPGQYQFQVPLRRPSESKRKNSP